MPRISAASLRFQRVRVSMRRINSRSAPRAAVRASDPDTPFDAAFERDLEAIRAAGIAHAVDAAVPGISALAAPVFDAAGCLVLSLTAIGPGPSFDVRDDGAPARALKACAAELSRQLGARA